MGKWKETVGIGFGTGRLKGTKKTTPVLHEDTGRVGGYQIEHWNDRVDADVRPETVKVKISMEGEG